eukprot:symbB.v1.2.002961.t1/scaffold154.1/size328988/6
MEQHEKRDLRLDRVDVEVLVAQSVASMQVPMVCAHVVTKKSMAGPHLYLIRRLRVQAPLVAPLPVPMAMLRQPPRTPQHQRQVDQRQASRQARLQRAVPNLRRWEPMIHVLVEVAKNTRNAMEEPSWSAKGQ